MTRGLSLLEPHERAFSSRMSYSLCLLAQDVSIMRTVALYVGVTLPTSLRFPLAKSCKAHLSCSQVT